MIESSMHYPDPDPDEGSNDEQRQGTEETPHDFFEMVRRDIKASAILVEAKKIIGTTIAARILSDYLTSTHSNSPVEITANSNVLRDKGRGNNFLRLKALFDASSDALPPDEKQELFQTARDYVQAKVLEHRPSAIWMPLPEARKLVVLLLRHTDASPLDIARTLSLYLRDTLELPLKKPLEGPPFSTLIKKRGQSTGRNGREVLAEEFSQGPGEPIEHLEGPALARAITDTQALLEIARERKHERSPVWRDEKARTLVAELLMDRNVSVKAILWAVKKFSGYDISAVGIEYQVYTHPGGRAGFAQSLLMGVQPIVRKDAKKMARVAKLGCYSFSMDSMIIKEFEKLGITDELKHQRLRSYFAKQMSSAVDASNILRAAAANSEKLMGALAVAKETDPTIRDLVAWGERQNRRFRMDDVYEFAARRGLVNLNLSRTTCDVIFILNGITSRGVMTLVRSGQRSIPQDRSLDAPLSADGDSGSLSDLVGSEDPEFERFEARDEMGKLLLASVQAGLLSEEAVASLKRVVAGEDLDQPGAYEELAAAVNAVPELRRLLGIEETDEET